MSCFPDTWSKVDRGAAEERGPAHGADLDSRLGSAPGTNRSARRSAIARSATLTVAQGPAPSPRLYVEETNHDLGIGCISGSAMVPHNMLNIGIMKTPSPNPSPRPGSAFNVAAAAMMHPAGATRPAPQEDALGADLVCHRAKLFSLSKTMDKLKLDRERSDQVGQAPSWSHKAVAVGAMMALCKDSADRGGVELARSRLSAERSRTAVAWPGKPTETEGTPVAPPEKPVGRRDAVQAAPASEPRGEDSMQAAFPGKPMDAYDMQMDATITPTDLARSGRDAPGSGSAGEDEGVDEDTNRDGRSSWDWNIKTARRATEQRRITQAGHTHGGAVVVHTNSPESFGGGLRVPGSKEVSPAQRRHIAAESASRNASCDTAASHNTSRNTSRSSNSRGNRRGGSSASPSRTHSQDGQGDGAERQSSPCTSKNLTVYRSSHGSAKGKRGAARRKPSPSGGGRRRPRSAKEDDDDDDIDDARLDDFFRDLFRQYCLLCDEHGRPLMNNTGLRNFFMAFLAGQEDSIIASADFLYADEIVRQEDLHYRYNLNKRDAKRGLCFDSFYLICVEVLPGGRSRKFAKQHFREFNGSAQLFRENLTPNLGGA